MADAIYCVHLIVYTHIASIATLNTEETLTQGGDTQSPAHRIRLVGRKVGQTLIHCMSYGISGDTDWLNSSLCVCTLEIPRLSGMTLEMASNFVRLNLSDPA